MAISHFPLPRWEGQGEGDLNFPTILTIAIGLSLDAFAVSVASGCIEKSMGFKSIFRIAIFFGLFQAIMPIAGWFMGNGIRVYVENYDHWVAFILLLAVGGKMIYESFNLNGEKKAFDPEKFHILLMLALATSIDALVIGFTLSFLSVKIVMPAVIIGMVTLVISFAGVHIGKKFGHIFENKIELIGGIVLIGIGLKILVEHL